jgi:hypothetical protein
MKKYLLFAILISLVTVPLAEARIKVIGQGTKMSFDSDSIKAGFKPSLELMNAKCVKCHSMERTVIAIQTGRAPVTGQPFNKQAIKAYGIKMLRKHNSGMNKQEIRDIVVFMNYLLDENVK